MWIDREITPILTNSIRERPVLVLTGARQVGKTSLLEKLFPHYDYVSLDVPSEAEQAEKNPEIFFSRFQKPLIIDEVQYAPAIFRHIKVIVDKNKKKMGQFILTGSQKFSLIKGIQESLAGRSDLIELEGLSFSEIKKEKPKTPLFDLILTGGMPELSANPNINRQRYLQSYLSTYLERDIRQILNINHLRDFERLVRACALRTGQLLNKADLARDVGVSPTTINEWISVLQASNQIFLLEPWFSNKSKSIIKSPKLYWGDTGMLCFLLNIQNELELVNSPLIGSIWETTVFSELRKNERSKSGSWNYNFWRDRNYEIDFVKHRGGKFDLIEAKWSENPTRKDTENFYYADKFLGSSNVLSRQIICRTPNKHLILDDIMATQIFTHNSN